MKQWQLVDLANSKVEIEIACSLVGVEFPDYSSGEINSGKLFCPFGAFYHSDGGAEPTARIYYERNSMTCFRGCGTFTPVSLVVKCTELSPYEAALVLLTKTGYKLPTVTEMWQEYLKGPSSIDKSELAEALKRYCNRKSLDWKNDQFKPEIAEFLNKCFTLLDKVETEEQSVRWLEISKRLMDKVLI